MRGRYFLRQVVTVGLTDAAVDLLRVHLSGGDGVVPDVDHAAADEEAGGEVGEDEDDEQDEDGVLVGVQVQAGDGSHGVYLNVPHGVCEEFLSDLE